MCCLFTCCGWVTDLVQRFWTFMMSCCISSAVCCALVTASMSGVALGYNYSLAEYIELKETNVSVYLKRGVFDDDVADEMEWRRSGGGEAGGPQPQIKPPEPQYPPPQPDQLGARRRMDSTPMTSDDEDMPIRYGRRMDDSIFQSDESHKYEGSLLKLTALDLATTTSRNAPGLALDSTEFPGADDHKALMALYHRRRMGDDPIPTSKVAVVEHPFPDPYPERRMIGDIHRDIEDLTTVRSLRLQDPIIPITYHPRGDSRLPMRLPSGEPNPETVQGILSKLLKHNKVKTLGHARVRTTVMAEETTTTLRAIAGFKIAENANEQELLRAASEQQSAGEFNKKLSEQENKDYSDDDIKGLPIRRRRGKRNIIDPDTNETAPSLNATIENNDTTLEGEIINKQGGKQNGNKENNMFKKYISDDDNNANNVLAVNEITDSDTDESSPTLRTTTQHEGTTLAREIVNKLGGKQNENKEDNVFQKIITGMKLNFTEPIIVFESSTSKTSDVSENVDPKVLNTDSVFQVTFPNIQSSINNGLLFKIIKSTFIA